MGGVFQVQQAELKDLVQAVVMDVEFEDCHMEKQISGVLKGYYIRLRLKATGTMSPSHLKLMQKFGSLARQVLFERYAYVL